MTSVTIDSTIEEYDDDTTDTTWPSADGTTSSSYVTPTGTATLAKLAVNPGDWIYANLGSEYVYTDGIVTFTFGAINNGDGTFTIAPNVGGSVSSPPATSNSGVTLPTTTVSSYSGPYAAITPSSSWNQGQDAFVDLELLGTVGYIQDPITHEYPILTPAGIPSMQGGDIADNAIGSRAHHHHDWEVGTIVNGGFQYITTGVGTGQLTLVPTVDAGGTTGVKFIPDGPLPRDAPFTATPVVLTTGTSPNIIINGVASVADNVNHQYSGVFPALTDSIAGGVPGAYVLLDVSATNLTNAGGAHPPVWYTAPAGTDLDQDIFINKIKIGAMSYNQDPGGDYYFHPSYPGTILGVGNNGVIPSNDSLTREQDFPHKPHKYQFDGFFFDFDPATPTYTYDGTAYTTQSGWQASMYARQYPGDRPVLTFWEHDPTTGQENADQPTTVLDKTGSATYPVSWCARANYFLVYNLSGSPETITGNMTAESAVLSGPPGTGGLGGNPTSDTIPSHTFKCTYYHPSKANKYLLVIGRISKSAQPDGGKPYLFIRGWHHGRRISPDKIPPNIFTRENDYPHANERWHFKDSHIEVGLPAGTSAKAPNFQSTLTLVGDNQPQTLTVAGTLTTTSFNVTPTTAVNFAPGQSVMVGAQGPTVVQISSSVGGVDTLTVYPALSVAPTAGDIVKGITNFEIEIYDNNILDPTGAVDTSYINSFYGTTPDVKALPDTIQTRASTITATGSTAFGVLPGDGALFSNGDSVLVSRYTTLTSVAYTVNVNTSTDTLTLVSGTTTADIFPGDIVQKTSTLVPSSVLITIPSGGRTCNIRGKYYVVFNMGPNAVGLVNNHKVNGGNSVSSHNIECVRYYPNNPELLVLGHVSPNVDKNGYLYISGSKHGIGLAAPNQMGKQHRTNQGPTIHGSGHFQNTTVAVAFTNTTAHTCSLSFNSIGGGTPKFIRDDGTWTDLTQTSLSGVGAGNIILFDTANAGSSTAFSFVSRLTDLSTLPNNLMKVGHISETPDVTLGVTGQYVFHGYHVGFHQVSQAHVALYSLAWPNIAPLGLDRQTWARTAMGQGHFSNTAIVMSSPQVGNNPTLNFVKVNSSATMKYVNQLGESTALTQTSLSCTAGDIVLFDITNPGGGTAFIRVAAGTDTTNITNSTHYMKIGYISDYPDPKSGTSVFHGYHVGFHQIQNAHLGGNSVDAGQYVNSSVGHSAINLLGTYNVPTQTVSVTGTTTPYTRATDLTSVPWKSSAPNSAVYVQVSDNLAGANSIQPVHLWATGQRGNPVSGSLTGADFQYVVRVSDSSVNLVFDKITPDSSGTATISYFFNNSSSVTSYSINFVIYAGIT
jgi:hypothetical protein